MKVTGNLIAFPTNPVYQYVSFSYIFEGDFDSAQSEYNYFIMGEEIVFPEPPEKENYTFAGWYRDRELTDKVEGTETCPETGAFFYGYYKSDIPMGQASSMTTASLQAHRPSPSLLPAGISTAALARGCIRRQQSLEMRQCIPDM